MNPQDASMESENPDPFKDYRVVKNIYGDYSIWPEIKDIPEGWSPVGISGDKATCLDWIGNNWEGPTLKRNRG